MVNCIDVIMISQFSKRVYLRQQDVLSLKEGKKMMHVSRVTCKKCGKPLTLFEGDVCLECEAENPDEFFIKVSPERYQTLLAKESAFDREHETLIKIEDAIVDMNKTMMYNTQEFNRGYKSCSKRITNIIKGGN